VKVNFILKFRHALRHRGDYSSRDPYSIRLPPLLRHLLPRNRREHFGPGGKEHVLDAISMRGDSVADRRQKLIHRPAIVVEFDGAPESAGSILTTLPVLGVIRRGVRTPIAVLHR
jgi:hypothetical protein